ncbi:phage tail assembly protein [Bradyrhizobium sp. DASA03120]|uniref:phage tail assembly protein n=1 Tax=Bradyrhizobium sp. SMVTL-02 TaxID=3395917 RepID=UPI003F70E3A6
MTITFALSQPLKTHNGDVSELTLKEPKAGLLVKYNDPFQIKPSKDSDGFEYVFDNKSIMQFAAAMTGVDDLILSDLSVSDFMRLRNKIAEIIVQVVPDRNPSAPPAV